MRCLTLGCVAACSAFLFASCSGGAAARSAPPAPPAPSPAAPLAVRASPPDVPALRLTDGPTADLVPGRAALGPARTLSQAETAALWATVPPWDATAEAPASEDSVAVAAPAPRGDRPRLSPAAARRGARLADEAPLTPPAPLTLTAAHCAYVRRCPAGAPLVVSFSAEIADNQDLAALVRVTPPLVQRDGSPARVVAQDHAIAVVGESRAHTTYSISVSSELRGVDGSTLDRDEVATLTVDGPDPLLAGPTGMLLLAPGDRRVLDVYSGAFTELRVRLYRVSAEHFADYVRAVEGARNGTFGELVDDRYVEVADPASGYHRTEIDLGPALPLGYGHVVARITPHPWPNADPPGAREVRVWVQATRLGLDVVSDEDTLHVMVSSLTTGAAVPRAEVSLGAGTRVVHTNHAGLARLPMPAYRSKTPMALVARLGDDMALVPGPRQARADDSAPWQRLSLKRIPELHFLTDRSTYQPGQQAHFKVWARSVGLGKAGDVAKARARVEARLHLRGGGVVKKALVVDGSGVGVIDVPKDATLGRASLVFDAEAEGYVVGRIFSLQIVAAQSPRHSVTLAPTTPAQLAGEPIDLVGSVADHAGEPVGGAEISWTAVGRVVRFVPPGRDEYEFGAFARERAPLEEKLVGQTEVEGFHTLRMEVAPAAQTLAFQVTAAIAGGHRPPLAASTELLVHPSERYVGVRLLRRVVGLGQPLELEAIAVALDGTIVPGAKVEVTAQRLHWHQGAWAAEPTPMARCALVMTSGASRCALEVRERGAFRVTAITLDAHGRRHATEVEAWVLGASPSGVDAAFEAPLRVRAERESYDVGDLAKIFVRAPFFPAAGMVTVRRSTGIQELWPIALSGPDATIEVPIGERLMPNAEVCVLLRGAASVAGAGTRPLATSACAALVISSSTRALDVEVTPTSEGARSERVELTVTVRDAAGQAVKGADVTLLVAEEATLMQADLVQADLLQAFYAPRKPGVVEHSSRTFAIATAAEVTAATKPNLHEILQGLQTPRERKSRADPWYVDTSSRASALTDLSLLAFHPELRTDRKGQARVSVTLPASEARLRAIAMVAAGARHFGKGERAIFSHLPLKVRPVAPRQLRVGAAFSLPVILHNPSDAPQTVRLAARATHLALRGTGAREITIAAGGRTAVQLPAVARRAGTARVQVVATSALGTTVVELDVPVSPPQ